MKKQPQLRIYEYFDKDGSPDHFACEGHIDSEAFRQECEKTYAVKPMVVQHRWQRSRRIVKRESEKHKTRSFMATVPCQSNEAGAKAVTVGLI
jgi:hypothetical protein